MKSIYIIGLLIITLTLSSCGDKFIELDPISTVNTELLYKTNEDFEGALIGCYAVLREQYKRYWIFTDLRSDDSWHQLGNSVRNISINNFTIDPNEGTLRSLWLDYYKLIYLANEILTRIEDVEPTSVTKKDQFVGEASFLRALAYFDLVRFFGDVPLLLRPLSISEAYQTGRESVPVVYEAIIQDLLVAEASLPSSYSGIELGKPTSGAAKSLLGKVFLTVKDYGKAEEKLQEVTTMGYKLLDNFEDLFDYSKDEHHSEYIFDVEYESGLGDLGSPFSNVFLPKSVGSTADRYFGVVGGAEENNNPTMDLLNAYDEGDLRRDITVTDGRGFYDDEGVFHSFVQIETFSRKHMAPTTGLYDSPVNWKILRYADVLLMYAEVLNENGKTIESLNFLNQVRKRAGLPDFSSSDKDEIRQAVLKERRLELALEGHRWFDLLRTGNAFSVLQSEGMKEFMNVYPIPLGEIRVINNESVLNQNPGY